MCQASAHYIYVLYIIYTVFFIYIYVHIYLQQYSEVGTQIILTVQRKLNMRWFK